jgi:predicted nucleotidyltransferase
LLMIEVFADVPPARKVALALRLRHELVVLLRSRLRREHPGCSDADLAWMAQEELDLLKKARGRPNP